jgi:hypothetical protein
MTYHDEDGKEVVEADRDARERGDVQGALQQARGARVLPDRRGRRVVAAHGHSGEAGRGRA